MEGQSLDVLICAPAGIHVHSPRSRRTSYAPAVRWSAMRAIAATVSALLGVLCTADGVPTRPIGNDVIVSLARVLSPP
jgi:hypothetical protein